jgi:hypothetical protein
MKCFCQHGNEHSGSIKAGNFMTIYTTINFSREVVYVMKLVNYTITHVLKYSKNEVLNSMMYYKTRELNVQCFIRRVAVSRCHS